jgi:hypothetical protein
MKMQKIILSLVMLLMCIASIVVAVKGEDEIQVNAQITKIADTPSDPTFTFISGTVGGYTISGQYVMQSVGVTKTLYGTNCAIGEYITLLACTAPSGVSCSRIFSDDYLVSKSGDYLDITAWKDAGWFTTATTGKYMGYMCKAKGAAAATTTTGSAAVATTDPTKFGRITNMAVSGRLEARPSSKYRVTGKYMALVDGPFVLEATIDTSSSTTFALIQSSSSACDGSKYFAGQKVNGIAGTEYSYDFTFLTPQTTGKYNLIVYSYTDCVKNGGKFITQYKYPIFINGTSAIKTCGLKDSDGDGVYDDCDYCPTTKGDPNAAAPGCHPCFGKSASSTCWDTYEKTWGIPESIKDLRNPITGSEQVCKDNKVQLCSVHLDVTFSDCTTIRETCGAIIKTLVHICIGDSVYSEIEGENEEPIFERSCKHGCSSGVCKGAPETINGGQEKSAVSTGTSSVTTSGECSKDSDCGSSRYCDADTQKCVLFDNNYAACTQDTDCQDGQKCSTELGICVNKLAGECKTDADCQSGEECLSEWCVIKLNAVDETSLSTCTEDQTEVCDNGETIILSSCVEGTLEPLGNACPNTESTTSSSAVEAGNLATKSKSAFSSFFNSDYFIYVVIGLIIAVFAYNYYFKAGSSKKRRR